MSLFFFVMLHEYEKGITTFVIFDAFQNQKIVRNGLKVTIIQNKIRVFTTKLGCFELYRQSKLGDL